MARATSLERYLATVGTSIMTYVAVVVETFPVQHLRLRRKLFSVVFFFSLREIDKYRVW